MNADAVEGVEGRIDHVAVAVRSIPDALPLFVEALGGRFLIAGDEEGQGFRWAQFLYPGGGKIELVSPLGGDGFVPRFLEARGEGVHHITFKVPDIERAISHLDARGIRLIGVNTKRRGWQEAFIHPKDAHGVLIQIAASPWSDEEVARHHLEAHEEGSHRHVLLEDLFD